MENELLPCPFCGGEAAIYEEILGGYIVQCHECCGQIGIMTKERAIAAWNTRAGRICTCGWHGFIDDWGYDAPNYCPNCGGRAMRDE